MQQVVLDSDIIIDFTRGANTLLSSLFHQASQKYIRIFVPSVVVAELMAGQETKKHEQLENLEQLFNTVEFIDMNYEISKVTGFLVRDFPVTVTLADAIVAASALTMKAKLATRNKKHFSQIPGLSFYKF